MDDQAKAEKSQFKDNLQFTRFVAAMRELKLTQGIEAVVIGKRLGVEIKLGITVYEAKTLQDFRVAGVRIFDIHAIKNNDVYYFKNEKMAVVFALKLTEAAMAGVSPDALARHFGVRVMNISGSKE